jgi:PDZ domain-containing protein
MNEPEDPYNPSVPDDTAPVADRRGPWGTRIIVATLVVVVAAIVTAAFVRVPYYRYSPGSLYHTEALISVDGTPAFTGDDGQIDFTTVSSKKASVLDYLFAHFDEAVELVDADKVEEGRTPEETRQVNLESMAGSKQLAEVAALRKLGYPVQMHGTGALVKKLDKDREGRDLPGASVLKVNDTIVEVDGQPVELGGDAVDAIGRHKAGDTITLKIESAPDDPGRVATVTAASRCVIIEGDCPDEERDKPLLGVRLSNRDTRFEMPVKLGIDTRDVGGPSAGLALTLGIIDVLTPGSLTGGAHVATTGMIDAEGNVGPIGGIRQKTALVVREGIPLFLVPAGDEAETAQRYAAGSGTKVVPVATLDEALKVLRENGGRTDVVGEAAAARAGTTAPLGPPG